MATELTVELIEGTRGRLTEEGWELTRKAIVSGFDAEMSGDEKIVAAAYATGMPSIGDEHPAFAERAYGTYTTAYLVAITPEAITSDAVTLNLTYKGGYTGGSHIGIASTGAVTQTETNLDCWDNLIVVEYEYPSDYKYNAALAGQTIEQGALVPMLTPEYSMSVTQDQDHAPYALQDDYVGTINSMNWQSSGDQYKWLCTGITGYKRGTRWTVTYSFQYKKNGWAADVVFIDPHTGKPPEDLVDGVGYKSVHIYPEANFNNLEFDF